MTCALVMFAVLFNELMIIYLLAWMPGYLISLALLSFFWFDRLGNLGVLNWTFGMEMDGMDGWNGICMYLIYSIGIAIFFGLLSFGGFRLDRETNLKFDAYHASDE